MGGTGVKIEIVDTDPVDNSSVKISSEQTTDRYVICSGQAHEAASTGCRTCSYDLRNNMLCKYFQPFLLGIYVEQKTATFVDGNGKLQEMVVLKNAHSAYKVEGKDANAQIARDLGAFATIVNPSSGEWKFKNQSSQAREIRRGYERLTAISDGLSPGQHL